jgi:hypothetical protein
MSFDFIESFTVEMPSVKEVDFDFSESFNSKHGLIIEVAAIHEGLTSNYNNYSAEELEKALKSWVEPYPKPIILNHDLNTEPIGRVIAARMDKESDGSSFVRLQVAITDPVAAQKVMDKRYLTGSVGGRASRAVCSISGEDLAQPTESGRPKAPKFRRGQVYKGKLAYIDMQDISFKEYSFVNQPADQKSGVRSTKHSDGDTPVTASDDWVARSAAFVLYMDDEDIISLQENESILKNMKKKDSKTVYLQTKGAFLSAIAVHESESDNNISNSLLSSEDSETVNSEENLIMDNNTKEEDILAVATELSQDLSNMASSKEEAKDEGQALEKEAIEESSEKEVAESNQEVEQISEQSEQQADDTVEQSSSSDSEESEVQNVDSEDPEELEEASTDKVDEVQEEVTQDSDLTTVQSSDEQDTAKLTTQVALLEEEISSLKDENSKLKSALHMTLVERVVDTKISLGLAEQSDRDGMIEAHASRTASSLADLLRDLASFSVKTGKRTKDFLTSNEFDVDNMVSFNEENVKTLDEEVIEKSNPADSFEQVLVDTLMGRRKL